MRRVLVLAAASAALAGACSLGLSESMVHGSHGVGGASSSADGGGTSTSCTPICTQNSCGDDGCDGSCGGCSTGDRCVSRVCQACDPWRKAPGGIQGRAHVALAPDALHVAAVDAGDSKSAWLASFDLCNGGFSAADQPGPTAASVGGTTIALGAHHVFFSATQTTHETFLAGAPLDGHAAWSKVIDGSVDGDEILDLAVGGDGDLWAVGVRSDGTRWRVKAAEDGRGYCEYVDATPGASSAIVRDGASVVVASVSGGALDLARYDDGCPIKPPCNCAASQVTATALTLGVSATAFGIVQLGGRIYVSGSRSTSGSDIEGYVARFDSGSFSHQATLAYHPSANDALIGIATDGFGLFVGGITSWDGQPDLQHGQGIIGIFQPDFGDGAMLTKTTAQSIADVSFLAADATGLYAAGTKTSGALVVMTCDKQGNCAP